jgi:hypothetical protein
MFHHSLALIVLLFVALIAPLLLLFIGPMLYGIPHLISSARYLPRFFVRDRHWSPLVLILTVVCVLLFLSESATAKSLSYRFNFWAFTLSFVAFSLWLFWKRQWSLSTLATRGVFAGILATVFWCYPVRTAASLMLIHNFVAYLFWWMSRKDSRESRTIILCALQFLGVHALIFSAYLDSFILNIDQSFLGSSVFGIRLVGIGAQIASAFDSDISTFYRAAVAYAVGQSLHYFVWLKAIPEQHLNKQFPTAFQESFRLLQRDMGRWMAVVAVAASLVFLLVHAVVPYANLRYAYLLLASYHGLAEIAALVAARRTA